MPEYIKALVVILALGASIFVVARGPALAAGMASSDYGRRRNLWFAVTVAAFLAHNFWIFVLLSVILVAMASAKETNKLALFFFLLFAVPAIASEIEGFGGIRHFFSVNYIRLLTLAILFPAFLAIRNDPDVEPFGRSLPDKLLTAYIVFNLALIGLNSSFTNTLRHGVFYAFLDIFLPYYIASRCIRTAAEFRDALVAFVVVALALGAIAAFEYGRHWLVYTPLQDAWDVRWGYGNYIERGDTGSLRAQASTGHPIILGYVMTVALGFCWAIKSSFSRMATLGAYAILCAGLFCSLSRGPWLGAASMIIAITATDRARGTTLLRIGLPILIVGLVVTALPTGQEIIDLLPFVGTDTGGSEEYRRRLLEVVIQVILQNPILGASDYIYSPAMEELRQGEGIIDIVNTYLGVGLSCGLLGLSLFAGFFLVIAAKILKGTMSRASSDDLRLLGQSLFATLVAILVIIGTTSSVGTIAVVYWSVAGLGVTYARLVVAPGALKTAEPSFRSDRRNPYGRGMGRA